ncbi:MAG: sterol desaturase family protein [Deltaproteobacteria bacterium]|nr:sterol desaturase family protein [Deltaproteobacteria bacterium]
MPSFEPALRLGVFLGVFLLLWAAESAWPRRRRLYPRTRRWPANLGVTLIDTLAVRLLFPLGAVGWALVVEHRGWGLLHALSVPRIAAVVLSAAALDLTVYAQHVVFHKIPALWRLHMVHHADRDLDVTSGTRFHPLEIGLSMLIKMVAVTLLGAPPEGVLLFEIVLSATAMFNHANLRLPRRADAVVRWLVVTPDMHRVHHSSDRGEHDSNFGFNLPWWDRLFGTYQAQPSLGHERMAVGLEDFGDDRPTRLLWILGAPFQREVLGRQKR